MGKKVVSDCSKVFDNIGDGIVFFARKNESPYSSPSLNVNSYYVISHNAQQYILPKTGIFDFSKKYWFKTTQDTTQMTFRAFQEN